jgi:hypothetical protein
MIKNKGTGAGGENTNLNGKPYELETDLETEYILLEKDKKYNKIMFQGSIKEFIKTTQTQFLQYMNDKKNKNIKNAHGCKNPDECYIDLYSKNIFIIEKKFQQVNGSVCEKIQTVDFKKWQYKRLFPDYNIIYIYCLSEWFKKNCEAELEYLYEKNIPIFYGNDKEYKLNIKNFIINY